MAINIKNLNPAVFLNSVGIGTPSPTQKLEVNGTVKVNSLMFSDGSTMTTAGGGGAVGALLTANNLSELTATASTARTNIGLGTISTQSAAAVVITGGTINGTTVGTTIAAAGAFTTGTFSGTLSVTGVATLGNGAVLGTPASGTVTNLTGTASININGTVGATTASTGAFTSLSSTIGVNLATSSGNVGISTPSPGYKLTVKDGSSQIAATDGTSAIGYINASSTQVQFGAVQSIPINFAINATNLATILPSGRVGIGTENPADQLTLNKTAGARNVINFSLGGSQKSIIGAAGAAGLIFSTATTDDLCMRVESGASILLGVGGIEKFRINSDGYVGIGTPTPSQKLEVAGTAKVTTLMFGDATTMTTAAVTVNLTGDVTSSGNATAIAAGVIINADINANAAIADTKLATISTASKVSNSATTATSSNTPSAIVARDGSGNFTAGTITAALTGNATTATTATNVTTNANLTGGVTSIGNAATVITNANLTGGVTSVGNAATVITNANLTGHVTSVGNATLLGSFTSAQLATALSDETGSGASVFATSPVLTTPNLGTPSAVVLTNASGTASININGTVGATTAATGAFTSLSSTTGANLATSSGNVGIGAASTNVRLSVTGAGGEPASSGSTPAGNFRITDGSNITLDIGTRNVSPYPVCIQAHDSANQAAGYPITLQLNGGNVGIGTASPSQKLEVNGTAKVSKLMFDDGSEITTVSGGGTTHTHAAEHIVSGTVATARLGSGTASSGNFLRGDSTWVTIPGGGNMLSTNNLSELTDTASTARTNIGLGTISTQSAAAVVITGGTINGTTVGTTIAAAGAFTTGTFSGTLSVTGVATLGNGAVLGTPASGTVTNLTGTASININGTVGATTPAAGAFTTGTFSGTLSVTGVATLGNGAILGTPASGLMTNVTGTASGLTAGNVTTNADLTGGVTSVGNAATVVINANLTGDITSIGNTTTLTNAPVIAKVLTGYTSAAGTVAAADSILQAIQKLNGNDGLKLNSSAVSVFGLTLIDDATAPVARETLGLASMATQSATSVVIIGGTINNTTVGAINAASGAFTTGTFSSTLGVTGALSVTGVATLNSVAITAGTINNTIVGATTPSTGAFTTGTFSGTLSVTGVATLGNGAVLGTPASGTVTNLTGTATININGTVGATTPAAGAFTTGTFSSTLGVTGVATLNSVAITAGTINGQKIGYLNIPPVGAKTAAYTLDLSDVGKFVELGTSGSVVVPTSVFAAGDVVSVVNNTTGTIVCSSHYATLYKGGTSAAISSFSITARGVATVFFLSGTVAIVTGNLV